MVQSDPFFEGALAPARWPHELEKPNPGFGRGGVAGVSGFGALRLCRLARRPILRGASGSGAPDFRRSMVRRLALCAASLPGA